MGCYQAFEWLKGVSLTLEAGSNSPRAESLLISDDLRMGAAGGAEDPDVTFIFPSKDERR